MQEKKLMLLGAGEQAKVITDIAVMTGWKIEGFLDDEKEGEFLDYPILGGMERAIEFQTACTFFIAIGNNGIRKQMAERLRSMNFATLVHPSAVTGANAVIGEGSAVMANAVLNPGSYVGRHCIINTACIVEHDCRIEDYVHLSPGSKLGGGVRVGEESWIGLGSCVRDHVQICSGCVVGTGAVVVKDIEKSGIYVGIPARRLEEK